MSKKTTVKFSQMSKTDLEAMSTKDSKHAYRAKMELERRSRLK